MTKGEELFNRSKQLFKFVNPITSSLQNPGCITTQDQVEELHQAMKVEVYNKENELIQYKSNVAQFWKDLIQAFQEGKL